MPTLLSDPPTSVYLLGAAIVIGLFAWVWIDRKRGSLIGLGIGVAILGLIGLIDMLFESGREESIRHTHAMVDAFNARQAEGGLAHVSEQFRYQNYDKKWLAEQLRSAVLRENVSKIVVTDFDRREVRQEGNDTQIGFQATVTTSFGPTIYFVLATYRLEGERRKLVNFRLYDKFQRTNAAEIVPTAWAK